MSGRHLPLAALVGFALLHGPAHGQPVVPLNHTAIYDPVQQRMIVFGGNELSQLSNATWQLTLGQNPQWSLLTPLGAPPSPRFGHAAVYDPTRHRMIVMGGYDGAARKADVWELLLTDPPEWRRMTPQDSVGQLGRRYHTAIYDPARDRVVIYGGEQQTSVPMGDTWSLWLSPVVRWEQMFPAGDPPVNRYTHSAIYDPVRDCMVVYGGLPVLNFTDLAELSLTDAAWRSLPKPPEPRIQGHSAIYDATRGRMVLFGGGELNQHFNDVWTMTPGSPPTWTELFPTGAPSPRSGHSAILDSVHQRMIVFGGFPNVTESTWGLSLESPSHWSPLRPLLSAGSPSLQLPTVTVGDTASVPMTLSNHGMSPLTVSGLQLPSGVTFGIQAPFQIDWNQSRTGTVTLVAATPGAASDSVVIESNDPVTPRAVIPLGIRVLGLGFRARVLAEPDSVPLGASFIVIASPEPGVHVERATLFYSIAEASSFDSLALTPLGTDFVGSVPATAVTERGVDYYVRVDNSGFSSWQPALAPDSVFTQRVARSDSIRGVPQPEFLSGRPIEVEVDLPLGSIFESGTIHYRRGGEASYATDPLARDVLGRPVATIPDTCVGSRGVEYWIEATTFGGPLQFASAQSPATIRVTVPSLQEPVSHPGMRYRLLSVPLDFGESSTSTLADLLSDQLGTYDPVRWRAYRYDPVLPGNVELSAPTLETFEPAPGRAFWLISRAAHRVNTGPVQGLSTPTNREYPVPLAVGWNAIGNPFDFPVAWADVRRDSIAVGEPVAFDWMGGSIGDYS
ncbi:MAG TPA: kelch repeat-containing protein, partial [Candidatus Eisenbacteria bacterium]|nr:kelch repeat-containing protein [Candidatus Eisenbacteria bacterium]